MHYLLAAAAFAATLLLSDCARTQVVPDRFGYQVTGQRGSAGEFCWQFDCTPRALTVVAGETLTLRVNAPNQNFFAIGASFSATSCTPIPGVANMLVLDPTVVTLALGVVSQSSPILACWGGMQNVRLALPNGLPSGLTFSTQALAVVPGTSGPTGPAFSVAVTATVQ